ncbi:hypothetical protein PYCC9005_001118 [Savitreella phatthalungensis]
MADCALAYRADLAHHDIPALLHSLSRRSLLPPILPRLPTATHPHTPLSARSASLERLLATCGVKYTPDPADSGFTDAVSEIGEIGVVVDAWALFYGVGVACESLRGFCDGGRFDSFYALTSPLLDRPAAHPRTPTRVRGWLVTLASVTVLMHGWQRKVKYVFDVMPQSLQPMVASNTGAVVSEASGSRAGGVSAEVQKDDPDGWVMVDVEDTDEGVLTLEG